ncbi:MAG: GNAT family N-acetyltransferase [Thermoplasmata archaeon]
MRIKLSSGEEGDKVPARPSHLSQYVELLKELVKDNESYVLVNYSGSLPDIKSVQNRSQTLNNWDIKIHFTIFDNRVVGYISQKVGPSYGSAPQPHASEIWYAVSQDYRGLGLNYGPFHASLTGSNVEYLEAYVDNRKSIRLLESWLRVAGSD